MKILVADDNETNRIVLEKYLKPYGDIDFAEDGLITIEMFSKALDNQPYDLICLDIMMPEMDGQDVLKVIRAIEKGKNIFGTESVKIIMVTALTDKDNIMYAFKSQCEAYVTKPINKKVLIKYLHNMKLI
jgi:two-component system chemotaxis response regulator CheY